MKRILLFGILLMVLTTSCAKRVKVQPLTPEPKPFDPSQMYVTLLA